MIGPIYPSSLSTVASGETAPSREFQAILTSSYVIKRSVEENDPVGNSYFGYHMRSSRKAVNYIVSLETNTIISVGGYFLFPF